MINLAAFAAAFGFSCLVSIVTFLHPCVVLGKIKVVFPNLGSVSCNQFFRFDDSVPKKLGVPMVSLIIPIVSDGFLGFVLGWDATLPCEIPRSARRANLRS